MESGDDFSMTHNTRPGFFFVAWRGVLEPRVKMFGVRERFFELEEGVGFGVVVVEMVMVEECISGDGDVEVVP